MTNNPFDALGGPGGLDLNALMQQAQQMQSSLQQAQEQLANTTVDGAVAGGAVTVKVSGTGDLVAVDISPEAIDGTDADALADLGDLIVAAYRDGRAKAEALAAETMGPLTGGLPGMPGGGAPGQLGF
ncbi:MAG: YbaB/EbfC family nucleoid-associated protein [Nocardioidaceae bacterium]|nr:YbaB/EbfC family nucleoid-associated protein [Nocardioidaceae bacterium]MCL2613231.1 YbaB/EbfC family nucleoid-associated protein [Nocardioidaceae bacterium]